MKMRIGIRNKLKRRIGVMVRNIQEFLLLLILSKFCNKGTDIISIVGKKITGSLSYPPQFMNYSREQSLNRSKR
jgi:hypothetical protein